MDLSDLEPARRDDTTRSGRRLEVTEWQGFIGALGAEIASPLTAALERINALTTTGRIDRRSLRALREEVERARQVGMASQQLARLGFVLRVRFETHRGLGGHVATEHDVL